MSRIPPASLALVFLIVTCVSSSSSRNTPKGRLELEEPQVTTGDRAMPPTLSEDRVFSMGDRARGVDAAYRDLESALRPFECTGCHVPDNLDPLDVFSYPNQALQSRHDIVRMLEANVMPPMGPDGRPGISDPDVRAELIRLAKEFETAADQALTRGPN